MAAKKDGDILDVAIVGGGVSGIYSGWRLLTAPDSDSSQKITLFEGSDRLAGRLMSAIPPGIPDARVELGGMRYTSTHTWVASLVHLLGLPTEPFFVAEPQNICYVRGKRLRHQDLTDASKLPYNLTEEESSPENLAAGFTAVAARRALRAALGKDVDLAKIDWQEDLKEARYQGHRFRELAMRYLFLRSVSHEAFEFAMATSGYDSIFHTWNAADGFPWNLADFGSNVSFHHVTSGFDQLPLQVAERFQKAGGNVELKHRLKSFDMVEHDGSKVMEMHFDDGSKSGKVVRARKLILAMPKHSLDLLDQSGAVLDPGNTEVHDLIGSVTPIPLFKLAICYSYPWWETVPPVEVDTASGPQLRKITRGESTTDLPVRQAYYWAVDKDSQNAVILIYDDGTDLEYWAGLRKAEEGYPDHLECIASTGSENWNDNKAPHLMVEEIHRQLLIMHGVQDRTDIPEPYSASFRDWGEDPYGGGANFWHVNVDSHRVSEEILQPKAGVPAYIVGEAYSHFQGWVEGPLRVTDRMLEKHFGLKKPEWLLPDPGTVVDSQFGHVNIVVDDLEGTRDFFVRNFGFNAGKATTLAGEWVDTITGFKNAVAEYIPLKMPPATNGNIQTAIELLHFQNPPSPATDGADVPNLMGYRHIGFNVDNIDALCEKLRKDPMVEKFLSEVVTVESMGVKTVYFVGPENVLIQLTQPIG